MINRIVFFNNFHVGDIFFSKAYLDRIIKQLPDIEFFYAHPYNQRLVHDLDINTDVGILRLDMEPISHQRFVQRDRCLFVNTWIGAYLDLLLPGELHGNYLSLRKMFSIIEHELVSRLGRSLEVVTENQFEVIPVTDWSRYNIAPIDQFCVEHQGQNLHLFCNGFVRAEQCHLGSMKNIIETLVELLPNDVFICTERFHTTAARIYFTDDITKTSADVNEIAYLSTRCQTIVGKNSGPYMYCHVRDNFFNDNRVFVSCSHRSSDSYPAHLTGFDCYYLHSTTDNPEIAAFNIFRGIRIQDHPDLVQAARGRLYQFS